MPEARVEELETKRLEGPRLLHALYMSNATLDIHVNENKRHAT